MARLSGLPSEHHHEGPGDAPRARRPRGRPAKSSQTPTEDNASQQNKRTLSPTAELSQTKRTRRVQIDADQQVSEQLVEESSTRSQQGDTIHVQTKATASTSRPNRRHSEPAANAQSDDNDEDELGTTTPPPTRLLHGLTPHLDRVGAPRNQFLNKRRARLSMPAQLHVERVDEQYDNNVQFQPLRTILDKRVSRSLRRNHLSEEMNAVEAKKKADKDKFLRLQRQIQLQDRKIRDLEEQLETQRLANIDVSDDVDAQALVDELAQARQEIDDLRQSEAYIGSDNDMGGFDGAADMSDDGNGDLVLVNPDDLHMSQDLELAPTQHGEFAAHVLELSSQFKFEQLPEVSELVHDTLIDDAEVTVPDALDDRSVQRYEAELHRYHRALGEAQGALRVITIELQNLHVLEPGAASDQILTELRHSLTILRQEVEKYFPGVCTGLTGSELLQKIPDLFGGLFYELREKTIHLETSRQKEKALHKQFEGVLGLLADSDERVKAQDNTIYQLARSNDEKLRENFDLQERITSLTVLGDEQKTQLMDQEAEIQGLQDQLEDKDSELEHLQRGLDKYREDIDNLTRTTSQVEADHHEIIAQMERQHGDIVADLQNQLGAEQDSREAAEADLDSKREDIDLLEGRISRLEEEVVNITTEMATLRERLEDETAGREIAENERNEQIGIVYQQTNTIENLEESITDLRDELAQLRDNLRAEKAQRELTEAALDEANDKIATANTNIHDLGVQNNELRSKLFQLQQEKAQAITNMERAAEDVEENMSQQLGTESQLREECETRISELNIQVAELQTTLANAEMEMANLADARDMLVEDRDNEIAGLNDQLADLSAKYVALENSTTAAITTLEANVNDLSLQVQRKDAEIKNLAERIIEQERVYDEDTTALKKNVDALEINLASERTANETLARENESLSERLEEGAIELVNLINIHNDEKKVLEDIIATQEAAIAKLRASAADRTVEHEQVIEERVREIEELRSLGEQHEDTIVAMNNQIDDLKKRFREQSDDLQKTIDDLVEVQKQMIDQNQAAADAIKGRAAQANYAVQQMKSQGFEVTTRGLTLNRTTTGRVSKASEKVKIAKKGGNKKSLRRQYDSGFGIDPDVEDATEGAEVGVDNMIAV